MLDFPQISGFATLAYYSYPLQLKRVFGLMQEVEQSEGIAMKSWLPCCLLCFAVSVSGCQSNAKSTAGVSAYDVPTDAWKPVTSVDDPQLQDGFGPVDPGAVPEFSTTESGLKYRILRHSDGKIPTKESRVTVNYRGWLGSGKVFDESFKRGEPTTFPLGSVVAGWTEGMQLVGEGGMIELWVPSKLGYGATGSPGAVPPHADIHFVVELLDVL